MAAKARKRRRGQTELTSKLQLTLPAAAAAAAGLEAGDIVQVEAAGRGRVVLSRVDDPVREYAGSEPGMYPPDYLEASRGDPRVEVLC
jgi:bifunctional DNA-binding transcriptional regulator/antitoxin component of YhaV-PrlF toxin-antitoxin module